MCQLGKGEKVMIDERVTLSVTEAAQRLGIGRNLAYEAVQRGEIPSIRVGGRILVPLAALEKLLEGPGTPNEYQQQNAAPVMPGSGAGGMNVDTSSR